MSNPQKLSELSILILQSPQFPLIPLLIVIILVLFAAVLVSTKKLLFFRTLAQTQKRFSPTVDEQEEIRAQLEIVTQQLAETQRQLREIQEQREAAQKPLVQEPESQDLFPQEENLLTNRAWLKLAEECVTFFDELERKSAGMDAPRQELSGYVCSQLEEILERCGVTVISGDAIFAEKRHRPYPAVSRVEAGTEIAETLSPGFVVGPRVLLRARVRLAEEKT